MSSSIRRPRPLASFAPAFLALGLHAAQADESGAGESRTTKDSAGQAEGGYRLGLGVGGFIQRKAYTDIDDDNRVLPLIYLENRWVRVFGGRIELKLPSAGPVGFALAAQYSRDGYEASDSPVLAGMEERESGAWLGASATWRNGIADVSAEWLRDAMGNSDGQQFKLAIEREFKTGTFGLTPRVVGTWVDDKYVDYYYGVRPSEAQAGRASYEGRSTINVEIGLRTSYAIAQRQTFFLDISGETLGGEIEDSPLTDRSSQTRLMVGYLYIF